MKIQKPEVRTLILTIHYIIFGMKEDVSGISERKHQKLSPEEIKF